MPVRVEIGPRDLEQGQATLVSRTGSEKQTVILAEVPKRVEALLDDIQTDIFEGAVSWRDSQIADASTIAEVREAAATGFARIPWADLGPEGEAVLAEEAVTVRCLCGARRAPGPSAAGSPSGWPICASAAATRRWSVCVTTCRFHRVSCDESSILYSVRRGLRPTPSDFGERRESDHCHNRKGARCQ